MIVGIDVSSLAREGLTGIGVYIKHLITALMQIDDIEVRAYYRSRAFAKRDLITRHLDVQTYRYKPFVSQRAVDVFHGPDFRLPRVRSTPSVVTVHDLAAFEVDLLADDFAQQARGRTKRLFRHRQPDRVIAVSKATEVRLLELFPRLAGTIDVVHLGFDPAVIVEHNDALPNEVRGEFVLYVGTIERRKNVTSVVDAFDLLRERNLSSGLQLVIAGGDGFDSDAVHRRIEASPFRDSIVRLGFVTDEMRAALYQSARVLIYPSLYEGFGLPVLEAMAAGCPVVTSNYGAVAEVAGAGALCVAPEPEAIAEAILSLINDDALRNSLIDKGRDRAATMTWAKCAASTVKVYKRTLAS